MRENKSLFERGLRDTLSSQKNLVKEKAGLWKEGPENYLKIKTTQQMTDQWREEAEDWISVGVVQRSGRGATCEAEASLGVPSARRGGWRPWWWPTQR